MTKTTLLTVGVIIAVIIVGGILMTGGDEAGITVSPTASALASPSTTVVASVTPTPGASTKASATPKPSPTKTPTPSSTPRASTVPLKTVTISYTDSGYSPSTVSINKADSVIFVNNSTKEMWPASAMHPSHNVYPEAGGCLGSKFDACAKIAVGQSWSFQFNQVGAWGFHDHLTPNFFGKITVQ
jgi:plastocyanin